MSRIRNARWVVPMAAAVGLMWAYAGRAQDPNAGQKVGAKVDEALQDLKSGLRKAGNAAKDQFSRAKTAIDDMGVESRVYGRIHWDQALNDDTIEISATDAGVVTLDGAVDNAKEKLKVVELARETVGVTKVVDKLAVRPDSAPTTTTAPARP